MKEQHSFTLSPAGIESVSNGELTAGDLLWVNVGGGKQQWLVAEIRDGKCFVQEPTIWDEAFARVVGWE